MNIFQITIQRKSGEGWPIVVEQSRADGSLPIRGEGVLQLNEQALRLEATPEAYGTRLGQALFADGVRDAFTRARTESADCLRVLLCIEDAGLKVLHWERLCAPLDGGWRFLALDQ